MLKTIIAPQLSYQSAFGDLVFLNVPVDVDADFLGEFDEKTTDYALRADVAEKLERFSAARWLHSYMKLDEDGNHPLRWILSRRESYGLMVFLGLNASELATLLGITKGTVSKVMNGALHFNPTCVKCLTLILGEELKKKGAARKILQGKLPHDMPRLPEDEHAPIPFPDAKLA